MAFSLKDFVVSINWRQIILHAIAFWFFVHAFETLSHLFYLKIIEAATTTGGDLKEMLQRQGVTTEDVVMFSVWESLSGTIGSLLAFFLSLFISLKQKWFWFNSLLAFILTIFLFRLHFWEHSKHIFYFPGRLFSNLILQILINGCLLLLIGSLLFFSKTITRFIAGMTNAD